MAFQSGAKEALEQLYPTMPQGLVQEIQQLESMLRVTTENLKAITDHFVNELAKGKSLIKKELVLF